MSRQQQQKEREDVPRISVDTLHDWERIKTSYTNAAMGELEARLSDTNEEGGTRTEEDKEVLRVHMRKFIERTFEMSKANLRINGRNFEDLNEEEQGFIEPFDEGLDRHIWSLSDQSLQWDGEIARKRREKPQEVERLMRELVDAQKVVDEEEEEAFAKVSTGSMALDGEEGEEANGGEDLAEYDVSNEVEDISRRTFAIVDELQQSVNLQHERSERLKSMTKEVKALKP